MLASRRCPGPLRLAILLCGLPALLAAPCLGALTLDRGAVIEGRVTDPDGAPVPETEVSLTPEIDPLTDVFVSDVFSGTRTDSEGRFRFEDLPQGARFNLRVERPGFVPAMIPSVEAPTPEPLGVEIELRKGRIVAGQVKSPEGKPVPHAQVFLQADPKVGLFSQGTTDNDGRFRLLGAQPGVAELTVLAQGYPQAHLVDLRIPEESDVEGLEIALHKGSVMEIQVLDPQRQPVAGALVTAFVQPSSGHQCQTGPEGCCRMEGMDAGLSDPFAQSEEPGQAKDGSLAVPRLASGAYTVFVRKEGFEPAQVKVEVRSGVVAPVEIELKPLQ
jgi:Carboxypeptidase regulatory-like domain